jgi:hypothetical protein
MKTLLLLLAFTIFSCEQGNCEDKVSELNKQFEDALFRCGNSAPAIQKTQLDYNKKLAEIYSKCN